MTTSNDDVLTEDMIDGAGEFDPSFMSDMELDGMDSKEFAKMIAETASAFLPPGSNPDEFIRRYVAMVHPLLKFGGFEKLTAGMTLGGLVDRHPWIGAIICSGATVFGLWVCWPKPAGPSLTPQQVEQIRQMEEQRRRFMERSHQGEEPEEEKGEDYA